MKQKIKKCLVVIGSNLSQILENKLEKSVQYTLLWNFLNCIQNGAKNLGLTLTCITWERKMLYSILKHNQYLNLMAHRDLWHLMEFCFTLFLNYWCFVTNINRTTFLIYQENFTKQHESLQAVLRNKNKYR